MHTYRQAYRQAYRHTGTQAYRHGRTAQGAQERPRKARGAGRRKTALGENSEGYKPRAAKVSKAEVSRKTSGH
jgi:hypothetical protein